MALTYLQRCLFAIPRDHQLIVGGDFNCNLLLPSPKLTRLTATLNHFGLTKVSFEAPTWFDSSGRSPPSQLDAFFVRLGGRIEFSLSLFRSRLSDHCGLRLHLHTSKPSKEECRRKRLLAALSSPYLPDVLKRYLPRIPLYYPDFVAFLHKLALKVAKTKGIESLAPNPVNSLLHAHLTGDQALWNRLALRSSLPSLIVKGGVHGGQTRTPPMPLLGQRSHHLPSKPQATILPPCIPPPPTPTPPQFPSPHYTLRYIHIHNKITNNKINLFSSVVCYIW